MGRMTTMSPLGLYRWDDTIFDLMQIPSALDKPTLIDNLLTETAELEVLYPNPVVFKNLVAVWSAKQLDIWNRLYATTQYEYNPIENYNRYETGSEGGTGRTTHSGTDTTADTTTYSGTDGRTEAIMQGGSDVNTRQMAEGGTQGDSITNSMAEGGSTTVAKQVAEGGSNTVAKQVAEGGTQGETTTAQMAQGGQDVVVGADTKGHWIAGFNSSASGQDDGLVKQTRDQDDATTTTTYGKTESDNGSKTTTFGKTESESDTTTFGKTESESDTTAYGKTESEMGSKTTTFGKTESESDTTAYGKTENVTETRTYGQTIQKAGNMTHGEQISTTNEGMHSLHAHGNIGVTTTQKLIREQRDIDLFNLYDIIIEDFKMRFCILIY